MRKALERPGVPWGHGNAGSGLLVGPWQYQSEVQEAGWVVPLPYTHPAVRATASCSTGNARPGTTLLLPGHANMTVLTPTKEILGV